MSNAGLGMVAHSIKQKVKEIVITGITLDEVLKRFENDEDIKILSVDQENKALIYHYKMGSMIQVRLIFDEGFRVVRYEVFHRDSKRILTKEEL